MKKLPLVLSAVAALICLPFQVARADARADDLIAAAKKATGGPAWDAIVTWHEKDKITTGGLVGEAESWMNLANQHNSGWWALGPASGGEGWDGAQLWTTDSSKEVRIEESQESLAGAKQDMFRNGYGIFFPDRFPSKVEFSGARKADGKSYDSIKVTPRGADPFEVWFDPSTHRIAREVQLTGGQPHSFIFSDYAPYGDIMVPRKTVDRIINNPKFDNVGEVVSITFSGPEKVGFYAPPAPPRNSAQWPEGKDFVSLPFRLLNNHIYLQASINGGAPVPFVFDTGATNVIEAATAKAAGAKVEGALPMGGFGSAVASSGLARVKTVSLGGLVLPDQVFITDEDSAWVAIEGAKSDGLIGYEFAKRAVLTVDYASRTITFTKPDAFHPPAGVDPVPFKFQDHTPMITASLDGIPGEFQLDTGSRAALTVMAPFAQAHGLVDKYHAKVIGTVGFGVGGPTRALLGRGGKLTIGSVSVAEPVVEISVDKGGVGSSTHTAGNIGGDILKRFTVTLDYAKRLAWFQPNELASRKEVFDRSGLWIARAGDGLIKIADVMEGSPAAKLGLVKGDELSSINGKSARDWQLYDLREAFKATEDASFKLAVKEKSGPKLVTLTLADQV